MSQTPSTNNKDEQKAASPGAETEIQAEIRALKAKLAEMKAAAAAATAATSEAKSSAESAPKPVAEPDVKLAPRPASERASSSTPATGGSAVNKSGYYESGERPSTDPKLNPPQQRERLQKTAPRPPQPKKPSTQGRVEQPAAKKREKKVKEQKELGNTERRAFLGGYEVTNGAEGLAGSKHAPGKTAPRQPAQLRGQGRGKRGGGQARGGAVIKKEEGERRGARVSGAAQRERLAMLPPPRPPPRQTLIPAPLVPAQLQACHVPYCQGNLAADHRFCTLCGTARETAQSQGTHPVHLAQYQGPWGGSPHLPYASSPLGAYESSPFSTPHQYGGYTQYPGHYDTRAPPFGYRPYFAPPPQALPPFGLHGYHQMPPPRSPAPSVDLTFHNTASSQPSSAPLAWSLTSGSVTPAPLATGPLRGVKRERSPSSSLHGESQPAQLSKRALKKIRRAEQRATEARAASTVLPSIETPQPQQLSQPSSVAEVPQQLPKRQSENSGDRPVKQSIKSEPDSSDEMEFAPASSDAGLIKEEPF